ncbi:MAG: T9SS C-terminal target domain-containing protein [Ignavibacteriae bacterium]|nr:MAG: T9SS C-terminal target domain-containing protein [Ignavibacteriota bacterium]
MRSQPDDTWSKVNIDSSGSTEYYRDLAIGGETACVLSDSSHMYEVDGTWKNRRYWKVYIIDKDGNQNVVRGDSIGDFAEGMTINGRTLFLYGGGKLLKLNVDDLTLDTMDVPDPGYIQSMHAAQDGQIVYVGRQIGISIDSGATWSFVNHPWPEWTVGSVHVFTDGRICFARPIENGDLRGVRVYTADPPYTSWDSTMAMEGGWVWPFNMDANESGLMVIASRSGSVAISTDKGDTWSVEKPMGDDYAELPAVVVTPNGVIRVAGAPSLILETSRTTAHVDEWVTGGHANCEASWKRGTIEIPMQTTTSATFAVYDLSGQAIAQGSAETVPSGLLCRTPNALAPGLYVITVVDGATRSTCRLMVTE